MTRRTGGLEYSRCMAGFTRSPAVIDAASAFICYGWMRLIKCRWPPFGCGVAGRAICTKLARMERRIAMTG